MFVYFFKKTSPVALVPVFVSFVLPFDYGVYGIAMIGCMQILREDTRFGAVALVLLNVLFLVPWNYQFLSVFAIPLILLHNIGYFKVKRESDEKVAYPLHLTLLYIINTFWIG